MRRVVVTGMGLVTAIGADESSVWTNLLAGRSGVRALRQFAVADNAVQIGGEVDSSAFDHILALNPKRTDRSLRFALEAARQALVQSGRLPAAPTSGQTAAEAAPQDVASIWGCGAGPTESLHAAHRQFADKGPRGMRPTTIPNCMANTIAAGISIRFQLTGANYVIVSACTSAANAIGVAFRMIRDGYAESVLCGGVDTPFDPFYYSMWNNLGVFSTLPDPAGAVRPFAADRAGTVLGEGAGALLLETLDAARARGARIRGEVAGYGESSDATHITAPSVAGQAKAIRDALGVAGVASSEIGYINAHGTGTDANDSTESEAIRAALGEDAANAIPVGAMKSYFGHTLGASGAIEAIATLVALEQRTAPPNLNLAQPDPACRLRLVGAAPEPLRGDVALKNSFGFGGGNAVLVLRRWNGDAV